MFARFVEEAGLVVKHFYISFIASKRNPVPEY